MMADRIGIVTKLAMDLARGDDGRMERGPSGGTFRARRKARLVDEAAARWLCVAVSSGRQFSVADDLAAIGFETFCPHGVRVHWRARGRRSGAKGESRGYAERDYPVFGAYVFVGEPSGLGLCLAKRSHPHILAVLDEGRRFVPAAFIRAAADLWFAGAWDGRTRPGVKYRRGDTVRVNAGAFAGLRAIIERMPSEVRAVVALELFGRAVFATVDSGVLELI